MLGNWFAKKCQFHSFKPVKTKYGFSLYYKGTASGWRVYIYNDGASFSICFFDGNHLIESYKARTESGLSRKMNIALSQC